ncbi:putative manganese-dependent inorganic diphosphatase [Caloramator sp. E03]|uniref:putative manganese-dependent inorganic diphosphatase n=1 Tax=Caloramator sp. E03 TaxID=2576307 RepID=UPI0011105A1D|nr:putative manganese-dependent inorganic diphosphatase [Caloramator sp. E03]QCX32614.1 putative manganese-dependent inorganic diphosphatase [Caloramator sp. E03]
MQDIIYITGHKNPDSDSVCSAIAYAELKRKLGFNATAAVLGELNRETEFILDYFKVPKPILLKTVKTQVCDLNVDNPIPVSPDVSIKTAWMLMKKNNIKTLSVVDDNGRLIGIVTLSDITNKYMDILENNIISTSKTPLRNIIETLNAKLITGSSEDFKTSGKVVVAAMAPEQMKPFIDVGDIVISGNRKDSQKAALEYGANCIIVTGDSKVDDEVVEIAKKKKCIIMTTPNDTFATARLINQSIPVKYIMTTENIISFETDDFVDEIKEKMLQTRYRSYPVVDENNKIIGFVSRYHLISQNKKKVILVDHNEKSQSVNGIDEADVLEIIDHHRVGDVQTGKPIYFRNEPVGSTATIVANIYFENGIRPSKSIAGLLCAAIISDTLNFKSPTCTFVDKHTAERLAEICNINIDEFAMKMFKAGTSLHGKLPEEIFNQDFKEFNFGKYKIGISQVNTMDTENIADIKNSLIEYMDKLCKDKNYNLVIMILTDIIKEGSELLFVGENKELISKAFNIQISGNSVYLPNIVSRKKQVVPPLSNAAIE